MNINDDQRSNMRVEYETAIWHENLLPGRFYKARIGNISQSGLYFESDQVLYQGEKIYIGCKKTASAKTISKESDRVEIKWRRDLEDSAFRFGYGAEFLESTNSLVNSSEITKIFNQNSQRTTGRIKLDPRGHIREYYRKEIVFTTKNHQYKGSIANISRGGAFIQTNNRFAMGQLIQLDIRNDKTLEAVRLKGWVVRLSPTGVGVRFDRRIRRGRRKIADRRVRKRPVKRGARLAP